MISISRFVVAFGAFNALSVTFMSMIWGLFGADFDSL